MKNNSRLRSNRGMTLTEVLVAFTLLVLIIMVFTPLFANYYKNVRTAGDTAKKTYERASLMERLVSNWGSNDTGYEQPHAKVPMVFSYGSSSLDYSTTPMRDGKDVEGNLISENINNPNSYVTLHTDTLSKQMVAFPKSLTDDFVTFDITLIAEGFKFTSAANFAVYNTTGITANTDKNLTDYFDVTIKNSSVAVITLHGGNEEICFERSPLLLTYYEGGNMAHTARVEIGAPEIILVGEAAIENGTKNYYYYATNGVDTDNDHMDIIAKKMTGTYTNDQGVEENTALVSAMNDVEWVAKGEGDNGEGGKNDYGYYVMGGDAGQVRRFWKQSDLLHNGSENYTWGGDYLYNYDSYASYYDGNQKTSDSYENFAITTKPTIQANFKKIVNSDLNLNSLNGFKPNTVLNYYKVGFKLEFLGLELFEFASRQWQALTTNYFTANVGSSDNQKISIARFLTYMPKNQSWRAGRAGQDVGHWESAAAGVSKEGGAEVDENNNLVTTIARSDGKTLSSKLDIEGYKEATDYPYANDPSLITITSVGSIKIDKNENYSEAAAAKSSLSDDVYPKKSYTLYCGYVPAVIDIYGRATHGTNTSDANANALSEDLKLGNNKWQHVGTYGIVTDGDSWYPTGKFGDIFTRSTSLDYDVFGDQAGIKENGKIVGLDYRKLLNFHDPNDNDFYSVYEAKIGGGGYETQTVHHDAEGYHGGIYKHVLRLKVHYRDWKLSTKTGYIEVEATTYNSKYEIDGNNQNWTQGSGDFDNLDQQIKDKIKNLDGYWYDTQKDQDSIESVEWSKYFVYNKTTGTWTEYYDTASYKSESVDLTTDGRQCSKKLGHLFCEYGKVDDCWKSDEKAYRDFIETKAAYDQDVQVAVPETDGIRFYGAQPDDGTEQSDGTVTKAVSYNDAPKSRTAIFHDDIGTALPAQNNGGFLTDRREVDITLGYLSHPYAIGVQNPETTNYYKKTGIGQGSNVIFGNDTEHTTFHEDNFDKDNHEETWDHTFFSGGMRDNVTMLDVKSYHDDVLNATFSLAAGYTLSYLFDDFRIVNSNYGAFGYTVKDATYNRTCALNQIMNTGIVYIRATGNGTNDDTKNSMASGKGWTLGYSTNVFHQFYGIDQYIDGKDGNDDIHWAALGWDTSYHRAYFNFQRQANLAVTPTTCINRTYGSDYGTYSHPLAQTECTCVNWGSTWDEKPQAMWGTANGTLMSWYYNYESNTGNNGKDIKDQSTSNGGGYALDNTTYSKINTVKKEFESYMWVDRITDSGSSTLNKQTGNYDYDSVNAGKTGQYGFISVLDSINDVAFGDGVWVAVGNQSGKNPKDYSASSTYSTNDNIDDGIGTGSRPGSGKAASYVNVKFKNSEGFTQWKAMRISDAKNVNILSVVYCQSVWYIMGYVDEDNNGVKGTTEKCVMYYSVNPSEDGSWKRCITRDKDGNYTYDTTAVRFEDDGISDMELTGVNKMASQG